MSQVADLGGLSLEQKRELAAKLLRQKARSRRDVASLTHRRIEIQAAQTPKAVALTCTDGSLTYSELNSRANRLARHLRKIGVGPEVLVGLCVGRSTDMVVGLLAILKAGGAYVPLDPAYPAERLAFMLDDARVSGSSDRGKTARRPAGLPGSRRLPRLGTGGRRCPERRESRGRARGVEPRLRDLHVGLDRQAQGRSGYSRRDRNLLESMRKLLSITERDALLAVTTLSFDIAGARDLSCP